MDTYTGTDREHLSTPFDHPVEVDGKTMNVNVQGSGSKNVVLLPGGGVTAPSYDFAPLISQLKDSSTVFTIDYFGSGLSDMTDTPRTSEQIAHEIHEALAGLGVKEYTLVAHSISGIYGLHYANLYPGEVTSFIGIDTATPQMDQYITPELLERVGASAPAPDPDKPHYVREDIVDVKGYEYSDKEIAVMQALYDRNSGNDDKFEAMKIRGQTDEREEKPYDIMRFPDNIPTKFFLSSESTGLAPDWYKREHEKQLTAAPGSSVIVLEGGHFLHHSQAAAIGQGIRS
jgi:pimeloyl-ACP methyl ester carboxylesterase